jgi:hypothetical protein
MSFRFGQEETFSLQEWTSIHKLSAMWEFNEIHNISIEHMFKMSMDVVEKIVIARDYNVKKWFIPSLNEYARLDRPISADDVDRLGLGCLLKIVDARQNGLRQLFPDLTCAICSINNGNLKVTEMKFIWQSDCTGVLLSVFQDEIRRVQKVWTMDRSLTDPHVYITTGTRRARVNEGNKESGQDGNKRTESDSCNYSSGSESNDGLDTKPPPKFFRVFHKLRKFFAQKL